jgi:hypothetical protein
MELKVPSLPILISKTLFHSDIAEFLQYFIRILIFRSLELEQPTFRLQPFLSGGNLSQGPIFSTISIKNYPLEDLVKYTFRNSVYKK